MRRSAVRRLGLAMVTAVLLMYAPSILHGQTGLADVLAQLEDRFDVVTLQQGIALVPKSVDTGVELIRIVGGVVTVDGVPVSGGELRDRLGADADLVLRASYLDGDTLQATEREPSRANGVTRNRVRDGDIVRFSDEVTVERDERVDGDVVVISGDASVDGEVTGDVVVVMGVLTLGPDAVIRGDVNVVGGGLTRASGSQVLGELNEVVFRGVGTMLGQLGDGEDRNDRRLGGRIVAPWSGVGGFVGTVARVILMVLVALIVLAVSRVTVERIAARTRTTPARAGLTGLAAEVLFTPLMAVTIGVLVVSIVGIPLLVLVPFAVLIVMVGAFVGYTGLAYQAGGVLTRRLGWTERSPYVTVGAGVIALAGLTLLAKLAGLALGAMFGVPLLVLGYGVEFLAWTVGFGAVILACVDWQRERRARVSASASTPTVSDGPSEEG
jgi:hypothetical protein